MSWQIIRGDCVEAMAGLDDCLVDSVVCDPPAGISFMGRAWDHHRGGMEQWIDWMAEVLAEAERVCKPGAHALVWALPRTSHWTGMAIERAGWEVRDRIAHHFGSGFPKSHNLPNGLGTALKPATEDWWLARKPLSGTVAANVLEHGTGALAIDACRVEGAVEATGDRRPHGNQWADAGFNGQPSEYQPNSSGRWPANVVLSHTVECVPVGTRKVKGVQQAAGSPGFGAERDDGYEHGTGRDHAPDTEITAWQCPTDCPVRLLDEQTGELTSGQPGIKWSGNEGAAYGAESRPPGTQMSGFGDSGGASRFFYVAKASRAERNAGLEGFEEQHRGDPNKPMSAQSRALCAKCGKQRVNVSGMCECDEPEWTSVDSAMRNHHPTVKPIELMRWLCRLVTPSGGTVLDPFAGSGTTGIAAVLEGFNFIGIEREDEYADIAEARIGWWEKHKGDGQAAAVLAAGEAREAVEATGQASFFDEDAA